MIDYQEENMEIPVQFEETLKGDSAYQVAVDNGFEGTEQEWLASLKGDKGVTNTPFIRTADKRLQEGDADSAVYMAGALTDDAREIPLGEKSLSMGDNSVAGAKNAIAAGKGNVIGEGGDDSVVVGKRNENYAQSSIVYGGVNENDANIDVGKNINRGARSLVGGKGNQNYATQSIINGEGNVNYGTHSLLTGGGHVNNEGAYKAFLGGSWNTNSAPESMIYGVLCENSAQYSTLFGLKNKNSGNLSLMGGEGNTNTNIRAVVFGENNKNAAQMVFVNGSSNENFETGHQAIVSGALNKNAAIDTIISGHGNTNEESGSGSVIGGWLGTNSGNGSEMNGWSNKNSGDFSAVFGKANVNQGAGSLLGGYNNKNSKVYSILLGESGVNDGAQSILVGAANTNKADRGAVFGWNNVNQGIQGFVSGRGNTNSGASSLLSGENNNNSGNRTVMGGRCLINANEDIGVFGKYNKGIPGARLEVGSGASESNRQSVFYATDNGAYVEKVDESNDYAVLNKKYVDDALADLPSGNGGIYVGSGDMPDGYNVQIDPSGNATDINAKVFEHIATITVSPAEDGSLPVSISFTADSEGKPFELTDVYVDMQAATVSGGSSGVYLQLGASNNNIGHVVANAKVGFYSSTLRQCYVGYFNENGYGVGYATKAVNINTSFDGFEPHCELSKYVVIPNFSKVYKPITRVNLLDSGGSNLGWIEGSTFKLYGVRA